MGNTITLNIGLKANNGTGEIPAGDALKALYNRVLEEFATPAQPIKALKIVPSTTERTLVVTFAPKDAIIFTDVRFRYMVYSLANILKQDCIAVREDLTGAGELIGPNAEKWGDFDPAEFIS